MTTREILEQAVTAKIAINSADTETKNKALAKQAGCRSGKRKDFRCND